MRQAGVLVLAVLFVCSLAVASFSETKPAAPSESKTVAPAVNKAASPAENKATAPEAKAESVKSISGKAAAVDVKAHAVTMKSKHAEVTISLNDTTAIMSDTEKKTIADIKVGDMLKIRYAEVDGKNIASRVKIMKVVVSAKNEKKEAEHSSEPAEKPAVK